MKIISIQASNEMGSNSQASIKIEYENSEALLTALSQTVIIQQAQIQALLNLGVLSLVNSGANTEEIINEALDKTLKNYLENVNKQFNESIRQAEEAIKRRDSKS